MKRAIALAVLAFATAPATAAEPVNMFTMDGTCHTLLLSYEDLSDRCNDKLMQIVYDTGRVGLYVTAPNLIVTFSGTSDEIVGNEIHQALDKILIGTDADNIREIAVRGTCTFGNPFDGPAEITCTARTKDRTDYTFEFTTDGTAPVDQMAD